MKRFEGWLTGVAITLLLLAVVAAPITVFAQDGHGEGETSGEGEGETHEGDTEETASGADAQHGDEFAALRGAAVYAEFCQACHGPQGESIGSGPAFAAIAFDPLVAPVVLVGGLDSDEGDGVAMPGYGRVLSDEQISDVLAYMGTWESGETPALPEPNVQVEVERVPDYFGDLHAGAEVYAKFCAGCHGPEGDGRRGDAFPELDFELHNVRLLTALGADSVYMPGFGAEAGGPLSEQQLTDLETYLASWKLDDDDADENSDAGVAVMIVILGVVAILTVGAAYMTRPSAPPEENEG